VRSARTTRTSDCYAWAPCSRSTVRFTCLSRTATSLTSVRVARRLCEQQRLAFRNGPALLACSLCAGNPRPRAEPIEPYRLKTVLVRTPGGPDMLEVCEAPVPEPRLDVGIFRQDMRPRGPRRTQHSSRRVGTNRESAQQYLLAQRLRRSPTIRSPLLCCTKLLVRACPGASSSLAPPVVSAALWCSSPSLPA
jgi:hypothetical protein